MKSPSAKHIYGMLDLGVEHSSGTQISFMQVLSNYTPIPLQIPQGFASCKTVFLSFLIR